MTKKILLICAGILLIFTAQAQNKKAAQYNNKIINLQYEVVPDVVAFFKAFENGNVADLKEKQGKLTKDFNKAISKINSMKAFEGDTKLKEAALDWFTLYQKSLENEYNHIITLAAKPKAERTEEDRAKLKQISDNLISQEKMVDDKFHEAQKEFSKKHNLELREYSM